MATAFAPRDTVAGFAGRTLKNLRYITKASDLRQVHLVTHLTISMLGLLVFPHEYLKRLPADSPIRQAYESEIRSLTSRKWPHWNKWAHHVGRPGNIQTRLCHLRNALSHRRIHFSSDSRELSDVTIDFWDQSNDRGPIKWHVSIRGDYLHKFVFQFGKLVARALG
jgi:hypothetical protein